MTKGLLREIISVLSEYSNEHNWLQTYGQYDTPTGKVWVGSGDGPSEARKILDKIAEETQVLNRTDIPEQYRLEL
jgi:hypothetical protein